MVAIIRIGIDVREFKKGTYTGLRTILSDFLDNVEKYSGTNEFVFFGNQNTEFTAISCQGKEVTIQEGNTFLWDQIKLPVQLRKEKIELFFSPYIKTPFYRSCKYVNTVCDIIPLMISKYRGVLSCFEKVHFFLYSFICSRRSILTITLSHDAKKKVCRTFKLEEGKVRVVYPSVSDFLTLEGNEERNRKISIEYDLDAPFILYVGNFKKHKNIIRLIESVNFMPEDMVSKYRLILVGGTTDQCQEIKTFVAEKKMETKVLIVSNLSHDYVNIFIKKAALFVFPSLAEGFGIPPVEAMKAGVAVAASNLPPMTEVLADAALYFDPYDPEDIANKVSSLLRDKALLAEYSGRGEARALSFSSDKMSENIMANLDFAVKSKILCLTSEYPPITGGISTQLYNLWNNFPKEKTVVLTSKPKSKDQNIGNNVTVLRRRYPLGGSIVSRVWRTLAVVIFALRQSCLWDVKCIHCAQVLSSGLAGLLLNKIKGVPYVVYIYSADILEFSKNIVTRYLINKILQKSKAIIANSLFTKSVIILRIKNVEDKIIISTPVIDQTKFEAEITREEARTKLKLPIDGKILLTVARLSRRKGHDVMIQTVGDLIKEGHDITYLIVGDGPMLGELKELVQDRALTSHVKFCGKVPQEELQYYYKACDVFCMVPKYMEKEGDSEGFGIVFLEAAICGIPVIAGASGGVKEAVLDGQTGLLVAPDDINEIKNAIMRLLNDEEFSRKLGENGKKRVEREFDIESRVEELIGLFPGSL